MREQKLIVYNPYHGDRQAVLGLSRLEQCRRVFGVWYTSRFRLSLSTRHTSRYGVYGFRVTCFRSLREPRLATKYAPPNLTPSFSNTLNPQASPSLQMSKPHAPTQEQQQSTASKISLNRLSPKSYTPSHKAYSGTLINLLQGR